MCNAWTTASVKTVQLSQVIQELSVDLQKFHVKFMNRYYQKLREDDIAFIETKVAQIQIDKIRQELLGLLDNPE